jgi:hypothetical protein
MGEVDPTLVEGNDGPAVSDNYEGPSLISSTGVQLALFKQFLAEWIISAHIAFVQVEMPTFVVFFVS